MSDAFYRPLTRPATFQGRVSTNRADKGFENYLNLRRGHYRMRVFLDGEEHQDVVTADPDTGTIKVYWGAQTVTLKGYVEIKLERS